MPRLHRLALACTLVATAALLGGCGGGSSTVTVTIADTGSQTDTGALTTETGQVTTDTGIDTSDRTALDNPADYDSALKVLQGGTPSDEAKAFFQTAGGAFFCDLGVDSGVSGCEFTKRLEAPTGLCPGGDTPTDVGRIEFDGATPRPVCNSDTIVRPDAPVMPDGGVARVNGSPIQCMNVGGAVMCLDTTAKTGFWVDPTKYVTF